MLRFTRKTWWASILVLVLTLAFSASVPTVSTASTGSGYLDDPSIGNGGGSGGTNGYGDPDVPTGSNGKRSLVRGSGQQVGSGTFAAGDGIHLDDTGWWRIQIMLQMVRNSFRAFP